MIKEQIDFDWSTNLPKNLPGMNIIKCKTQHYMPIKCYCESSELQLTKATQMSVGYDLRAKENYTIHVGETTYVETGIFLEIPEGFVGKIYSRSGLSTKHGVVLVNGTGIIDSDYRGEIMVALTLLSGYKLRPPTYEIKKHDRVAQILFEKVENTNIEYVESCDKLCKTERGVGGFGSSGK
jgi:dUTP pyrophosphatase